MSWRILSCDAPVTPSLLVKLHFASTGYSIELTDLSRIWSETLSKTDIIQRATDSGSSIDPSEDEEQFQILLGKVQSALNEEDGTALELSSSDDLDLQLDLVAPLPKPLAPFKWNVHLRLQPEERISSELLAPLILQASSLQRNIQQLIDQIHDKDRVISKICERLETSGNDLTTVFPGVSNIRTSRKKGQREQLAKHVKGLEDFDEALWSTQSRSPSGHEGLNQQILNDVFKDLPPSGGQSKDDQIQKWWTRLSKDSESGPAPQLASGETSTIPASFEERNAINGQENDDESMQVDDFQRQRTPPHLRHATTHMVDSNPSGSRKFALTADGVDTHKAVSDGNEDSTTDDDGDDDLDAPSQRRPSSQPREVETPSKTAQASPPKKLGMVGGRQLQPQPSPPQEPAARELRESPKPKSKLGAIGGRRTPSVPVPGAASQEDSDATQESPPKKMPRLGAIGGKKTANTIASASSVATQLEYSEPHGSLACTEAKLSKREATAPPQQTAEEVADMKRDRLKLELEEKAKAPVKKKRKF